MTTSSFLYIAIPLLNCLGNILLKLSVNEKAKDGRLLFLTKQFFGYGIFILVIGLSNVFLLTHASSYFVIILSLNYLTTLQISRWYFHEHFFMKDIFCDIFIVFGTFIFYKGL